MTGRKRTYVTLLAAAALALAVVGAALAHGVPGGRGQGGRGGPPPSSVVPSRPGHPIGLLRQLVYPCLASCGDAAKACNDAADDAALTCTSAACPTEITAAQAACAEDSRDSACRDAISALRDCADDCLDTRATAVSACRTALAECADACDTTED